MPFKAKTKTKVMIVDDHSDSLLYAQAASEYLGYSVVTTQYGGEALGLAITSSPDIILLDLLLDGMYGTEVLQQLQSNFVTAHVPVIAVTALVTEIESLKKRALGFSAFLEKPYMIEDLSTALLNVRQDKRKRRKIVALPGSNNLDLSAQATA